MRKILKNIIDNTCFIPCYNTGIILSASANSRRCRSISIDIKDSSDYHFVTKSQLLNLVYGSTGKIIGRPVKDISVSEIESRINGSERIKGGRSVYDN